MTIIAELTHRAREGQLKCSMEWFMEREFYPPVNGFRIRLAETHLGFALPPLLRDLYMNVANGGFGPGYGLVGVRGGATVSRGGRESSLVPLYYRFLFRRTRKEPWEDRYLPICTWGCTYYSFVDCAHPDAPVFAFDENTHGYGPWGCAFALHAHSFEEWIQRWVDGEDLWESFSAHGEPIFGYLENQEPEALPGD
jgi:hypothetical protein